jgi:hypothetical protein
MIYDRSRYFFYDLSDLGSDVLSVVNELDKLDVLSSDEKWYAIQSIIKEYEKRGNSAWSD